MKKDVIGLSTAVTDIFINVTDAELEELGLKKGFAHGKKKFYANPKHKEIISREQTHIPGGSTANVISGTAVLGLKSGIIGTIGHDIIGKRFREYVQKAGIQDFLTQAKGKSGICYAFIAPDKEKTFVAELNIAKDYKIKPPNLDKYFQDYQIFHTCGYQLWVNPEKVLNAMRYAKKKGMKISFDLADPCVPQEVDKRIKGGTKQALNLVDYLTLTKDELKAYTGLGLEESIREVQGMSKIIIVKKGGKGSELVTKDKRVHIPPAKIKLVNTTGAGDTYSAGLLYGIQKAWSPEASARLGSYVAGLSCSQQGARLKPLNEY